MKTKKIVVLLCIIGIITSMMIPAALAADFSGDWIMKVQKIDVVDRLETTQTMTNYDGSTYEQTFTDEPTDGFCYAVVTIGVTKQSIDASAFPINEIRLNVSGGGTFACCTSNSFLRNHNYDIFESTSLLVSDVGALCFEIPESYLGDNGDGWYVSYNNLESAPYYAGAVQEVPYAQNEVDAQEQYEAAVLREYEEVGPLSLQNAMIVQDLYGNAPLTAIALFDTETACDVTVTVHGKTSEADITYSVGDVVTQHQVPIFGLYAGMENRVTITAGEESWDHYITTDRFPIVLIWKFWQMSLII